MILLWFYCPCFLQAYRKKADKKAGKKTSKYILDQI